MELATKINPVSIKDDLDDYTKAFAVVSVKLEIEGRGMRLVISDRATDPNTKDVYLLVRCSFKNNNYGNNWYIINGAKEIHKLDSLRIDSYYQREQQPNEINVDGERLQFWVDLSVNEVDRSQEMFIIEAAKRFSSDIFKDRDVV